MSLSYGINRVFFRANDGTIGFELFEMCSVDTSTTGPGATITANASGGTYQWIDCNSGLPITGETNQSFTPTMNGDFAVIISANGCVRSEERRVGKECMCGGGAEH